VFFIIYWFTKEKNDSKKKILEQSKKRENRNLIQFFSTNYTEEQNWGHFCCNLALEKGTAYTAF
jgi:hypothetical protein